MTTTSNVTSAVGLATADVTDATSGVITAGNKGTTVHRDIFGGSVTDEMLKLMPMFDHNQLG